MRSAPAERRCHGLRGAPAPAQEPARAWQNNTPEKTSGRFEVAADRGGRGRSDERVDPSAAESVLLYSLIETAKANGREPYQYLRELFEKLPLARTRADYLAQVAGRRLNVPETAHMPLAAGLFFITPALQNLDVAFQGLNTWHSFPVPRDGDLPQRPPAGHTAGAAPPRSPASRRPDCRLRRALHRLY